MGRRPDRQAACDNPPEGACLEARAARHRGYPQFRSLWEPPLQGLLSCVFARILRSLMYRLLSWQLKKPQSGTSKHEVREKACHVALPALPRERAGGDP